MIIKVEAYRLTGNAEEMTITKKVMRMSKLEETVRLLREACMIWEDGPKKKSKDPPQGSP